MSAPERNRALARIKTAMIEKKMTQAELADAADCHEKTIQNLLNGRPVRDQTLFDVCMVLGLPFEDLKQTAAEGSARDEPGQRSSTADVAPVDMGAYTRAAVDHYLGNYLTLRPSFTQPGAIMAYRTDITWDEEWPSLLFQERDRVDQPYSHRGRVYVPAASMFIHLVSLTKGSMRMVVLSQVDSLGQMRGLITTLNKQKAMLVPVSAPIAYTRIGTHERPAFGEIKEDHASHAEYRTMLAETLDGAYARLIGH